MNSIKINFFNKATLQKKLLYIYLFTVIISPVIFFVYYNFGMVCKPRAYIFEIITGLVSLGIYFLAYKTEKIFVFFIAALVPVYIIVIAPITMATKLGINKWLNQRLTAFLTFEAVAIIQVIIISVAAGCLIKPKKPVLN